MLFAHDRVKVLAGVAGDSPYGGSRLDWAAPTVVATVPANVQPAAVSEDVVNAQRIEARFEVRVPAWTPVTEVNRVRWDAGDGQGELDYEIVAARPWRRGTPGLRHTHLITQRVTGG